MKLNLVGPFKVNYPFATEIVFSYGLKNIGHNVIEFDPNVDDRSVLDKDADFTFVFKSALDHDEYVAQLGPKVILYQPDDPRISHIKQMLRRMRRYSEHLLLFRDIRDNELGELNFIKSLNFKTVGSLYLSAHPDVYRRVKQTHDVDFCFVGSIGDRSCHWQRHRMISLLKDRGYSFTFGQTMDGDEMRDTLSAAKVVLNHAADRDLPFGVGYGYQCRHFEVGMTKSCLLSNSIIGEEDGNYFIDNFCRFNDENSFIEAADFLIKNEGIRLKYANNLYNEVMTYHSPEVRAKQLIEILEKL